MVPVKYMTKHAESELISSAILLNVATASISRAETCRSADL